MIIIQQFFLMYFILCHYVKNMMHSIFSILGRNLLDLATTKTKILSNSCKNRSCSAFKIFVFILYLMSIIIKSFNVSVFPSFWCVLKTDVPMLFFCTGIPCFTALHIIVFLDFSFFTNGRFLATLQQIYWCHFSNSICSL